MYVCVVLFVACLSVVCLFVCSFVGSFVCMCCLGVLVVGLLV